MEHTVDEKKVLQFYIEQMDADNIAFLQGREHLKEELRGTLNQMLEANTMNEKIHVAVSLWKQLFSASMSQIDPNKNGYDKLFNYFDEYVEFEELIFASDSFYRDHTLHCLWVYFLGEYIYRTEEFKPIFDLSLRERWMVEILLKVLDDPIFKEDERFRTILHRLNSYVSVSKYEEACRCVSALTHDLGYPIKKIGKINKAIKKVLPYYSINNFNDFSFQYDSIQNNFISNFLDLLSRKAMINFNLRSEVLETDSELFRALCKIFEMDPLGNGMVAKNPAEIEELTLEEKVLFKNSVDPQVDFRLDYALMQAMHNDFEEYQHGIMSAFLLVKNLDAFRNMSFDPSGSDAADSISQFGSFVNKLNILSGISNHTLDSYHITMVDNTGSFLTFVDELEEFSRISRASQNREYVEEFCTTRLYMKDGNFHIDFIFENDDLESLDPEKAFKGRCKRFLKLFNIPNMDPKLNIILRCIGKLENNNHIYELQVGNKHADILIDGVSQNIPRYLKSNQFYTKEEYAQL